MKQHQYISLETKALVLEKLKLFKNDYYKVAAQTGMTVGQVRWIDAKENKTFNFTEEGKGRPELQCYIVAIRCREDTCEWDNADPKIKFARELYDQGIVELTYGYDGLNMIMYAIPRREKITRKSYFKLLEENEDAAI